MAYIPVSSPEEVPKGLSWMEIAGLVVGPLLLVLLLVLLTCYLLNRKNTKNPLHRYAESG